MIFAQPDLTHFEIRAWSPYFTHEIFTKLSSHLKWIGKQIFFHHMTSHGEKVQNFPLGTSQKVPIASKPHASKGKSTTYCLSYLVSQLQRMTDLAILNGLPEIYLFRYFHIGSVILPSLDFCRMVGAQFSKPRSFCRRFNSFLSKEVGKLWSIWDSKQNKNYNRRSNIKKADRQQKGTMCSCSEIHAELETIFILKLSLAYSQADYNMP